MRCSVIISCYNYARYVAQAIDSVLAQSYPNVELIIVDDGSTDDSRRVIERYSDRAICVFQNNRGQAGAANAGYRKSTGEIVIFLDADDILLRDTIEKVVAVWSNGTVKVQYRLQKMDADGNCLAEIFPERLAADDEIMHTVARFGFYPCPATSGNAYARHFLEIVMPIPETIYRTGADTYLLAFAPFFGAVRSLSCVGAHYRVHGTNMSARSLDRLADKIARETALFDQVAMRCHSKRMWPQHLKHRIILDKFGDQRDRLSRARLCLQMIMQGMRWPGYSIKTKLKIIIWTVLMGIVPRRFLKSSRFVGATVVL